MRRDWDFAKHKAPFCLARSWCKYRSSRQILGWVKSNLGFVNFSSYYTLSAVTKVSVILNLHLTCKAYMIEKIMVEVIWWKRLVHACWRINHAKLRRAQDVWTLLLCRILYSAEPWIMNRNHLHYQRRFYLSKPTESIPSQAHQLICEMLEINFQSSLADSDRAHSLIILLP